MWERSSFSPWHFLWRSERCKRRFFSPLKPRRCTGVGYKEERLIFPTIQPRNLEPPEPNLCNSTGKTKYKPFSIVALSVLPASFLLLTWPMLGLKASLLWKRLRETFRNDAHSCASLLWEVPLNKDISSQELQPLSSTETLPLLSHILGSHQDQEYLWVGSHTAIDLLYWATWATRPIQQEHHWKRWSLQSEQWGTSAQTTPSTRCWSKISLSHLT